MLSFKKLKIENVYFSFSDMSILSEMVYAVGEELVSDEDLEWVCKY